MAIIKTLEGKTPKFGERIFLAETSVIIGDVVFGTDCSVWYNSVIRGDVNFIKIGNRVNVQDLVTIHCTYQKYSTIIGDDVSIGHNAIVHGCRVHDKVLIGMGAIIMDNVTIESNSIVAAGSVVTENILIKSNEIWAGIPARKIKDISEEGINRIEEIAKNYIKYSYWYNS